MGLWDRIWENFDFLKLGLCLGMGYAVGRLFVDTIEYTLKHAYGFILRKRLDRMANRLIKAQKELTDALKSE